MNSESRSHYDRIAKEAILFCQDLQKRDEDTLTPAEKRLLDVVDRYQEFVEVPAVRSNWAARLRGRG